MSMTMSSYSADQRLEHVGQEPLSAELAHEAHLDAGERRCGGDQVDAVDVGDDRVGGSGATGEDVDEVDAERAFLGAELAG